MYPELEESSGETASIREEGLRKERLGGGGVIQEEGLHEERLGGGGGWEGLWKTGLCT